MRARTVQCLALACALTFALPAFQSTAEQTQFNEARQLLTGAYKDPDKARQLLVDLVSAPNPGLDPDARTYALVYLGYIEDRAGNRDAALTWFRKAAAIEGASPGILAVANAGMKQPVLYIRHLDSHEPLPGAPLAKSLSPEARRENFEALWKAIDTSYAMFDLKSIDWNEVGRTYRQRLDTVTNDDDFYLLLYRLVNELKDTHSWLQNYTPPRISGVPELPVELVAGKPFIVAGPKAGFEVISVDGMDPAKKMEALRPLLAARSSDRAYQREAAKSLFSGAVGTQVKIELRFPDGRSETGTYERRFGQPAQRPPRSTGIVLTRGQFVNYGRHSSGLGYIQIVSFNGRGEIDDEFNHALEALRDTPGLLLDIRDNAGGFNHDRVVGRFLSERTETTIGYRKNGPGHRDLERRPGHVEPAGPWQYKAPVALLVNEDTGSASDLFACELRSARRVTTVGTTTHGNLSGVSTNVTLPCGLTVRISNGYVCDARNRPVEVTGNVPDVVVEPGILDVLNGRDPVLQRAVDVLQGIIGKAGKPPLG
jgi:carboxyl-terminal processing protease